MKFVAKFIFWLIGWKVDPNPPEGIQKCVVAVGPHTSNWDFILGRLAFYQYGVKGRYLMKKELFWGPLGWFLKYIGGIPVDRSKKNNLTDTAVRYFEENESMYLVFSPEGTRSYNPNWKKGFYYVAQKANVPIYVAYIDFASKTGGFHSLFWPTGDADADIQKIKDILKQYKGRYPELGID
jgi:1-acyl-sn-glycerol-3-phosphate acyltransferase